MSITSSKNNSDWSRNQVCKTCLVKAACSMKGKPYSNINCGYIREEAMKEAKRSIEYLVEEYNNGNTSVKELLCRWYIVAKEFNEDLDVTKL